MCPDHDINAKGRAILSHLQRLGLKQVHEPTFATAAALLMIAQEGVTKARSTSYVDDMYNHLKNLWRRVSRAFLPSLDEIRELPGTAVDFRSQHPSTYRAIFGDSLPAVPRISLMDIKAISANVSQRPRKGQKADAVGQFCQQIVQRLGMQQEQLADGSTLTFSPPGGRSRSMSGMIGAAAGSLFGAHRSPQPSLEDEFGGGGGRGVPRPAANGVDGASGDRVAEPHPEVVAGASGSGLVAHVPPVLPEKNSKKRKRSVEEAAQKIVGAMDYQALEKTEEAQATQEAQKTQEAEEGHKHGGHKHGAPEETQEEK